MKHADQRDAMNPGKPAYSAWEEHAQDSAARFGAGGSQAGEAAHASSSASEASSRPAAPSPSAAAADTPPPIRVLLADDHRTMLWGLTALIQSARPRMEVVAVAASCEEALRCNATLQPDLILLDLDMNGECGLDILPGLLACGSPRVLILTASRDQALIDSAVRHGARGVVHKDAPADQVLKAIDRVHRGELWLDQETLGRVMGALLQPAAAAKNDPEARKQASLTGRERKIIGTILAESGAPNKIIAGKLFISEHTLRNHLTSIYQKLEVANRLELYVYATRHGLLASDEAAGASAGAARPVAGRPAVTAPPAALSSSPAASGGLLSASRSARAVWSS